MLLREGLGNQLYQISFLNYLNKIKTTDRTVLFYFKQETGDSHDKTKRNVFTDILDRLNLKAYPVNKKWYWRAEKVASHLRRFIKPLICFHYEPLKQHAVFQPAPIFEEGKLRHRAFKNIYVGDFQSYQYLDSDFTHRIYETLRDCVSRSTPKPMLSDVAIHLRRGDFMKVQNIFRCFTSDYYLRGLSLLEQEEPIGKVYVFSDDSRLSKAN